MKGRAAWLLAKQSVLWLGLLLCGYALWRTRELAAEAFSRMYASSWAWVALLLLLGWGLAAASWRRYLHAYTGQLPGWGMAVRQLGLLLVGKYVPGGVFGFLARMYDQTNAPRKQLFWAGLSEQAVGVGMPLALGGALYLAASRHNVAWLALILFLPLLAIAGIRLLHRLAAYLPWLRLHVLPPPPWRRLLPATLLQVTQLLAWVALVAMLSRQLHGLDGLASLGIAGAFLLAVAAGMIVMVVPGGIGVRETTLIGLSSHWLGISQAIFLTAFLRLLSSLLDVFAGLLATAAGTRGEGK